MRKGRHIVIDKDEVEKAALMDDDAETLKADIRRLNVALATINPQLRIGWHEYQAMCVHFILTPNCLGLHQQIESLLANESRARYSLCDAFCHVSEDGYPSSMTVKRPTLAIVRKTFTRRPPWSWCGLLGMTILLLICLLSCCLTL